MNIAIVVCGLVGNKRAKQLAGCKLVAVHDINKQKCIDLISATGYTDCVIENDWKNAVTRNDVDVVIVATMHNMLAEITIAALEAGKHVLVEKPVGKDIEDINNIILAADKAGKMVRVGFNHRYHPAMMKATKLIEQGYIGDIMYIRARYGHGGRVGYNKEWRGDPKLAGGGELVEQGIHIIDLAQKFLGKFTDVKGFAETFYWDQVLDDNAFLTLRNDKKQTAFIHVSCTEWKNTFSFEIYGKKGKLEVNGLGGSYGIETLKYYEVRPEMGPPHTTIWEYPQEDKSWEQEIIEFMEDIRTNRTPEAGLQSARNAWEVINIIYGASK